MRVLFAAAAAALFASTPASATTYFFNVSAPAINGILSFGAQPISGLTLTQGDVVDITFTFDGGMMSIPANWVASISTLIQTANNSGSYTTSFTNELIDASGPSPFASQGEGQANNGLYAPVTAGSVVVVPEALSFRGIHQTLTFVSGPSFDPFRLNIGVFAVPEPATWALMIGGFGMIGAAARRRSEDRAAVQPAHQRA